MESCLRGQVSVGSPFAIACLFRHCCRCLSQRASTGGPEVFRTCEENVSIRAALQTAECPCDVIFAHGPRYFLIRGNEVKTSRLVSLPSAFGLRSEICPVIWPLLDGVYYKGRHRPKLLPKIFRREDPSACQRCHRSLSTDAPSFVLNTAEIGIEFEIGKMT